MFLFKQLCNEHAEERMNQRGTGLYMSMLVVVSSLTLILTFGLLPICYEQGLTDK
jgi:hypothetical protein